MRAARCRHHLDAPELRKRPRQVGVGELARLRVVVTHQAAQVTADRSEIRRLHGHRPGQLALDADRPLPDVRRRLGVLGSQNEGRCAGTGERLLVAQVRTEALGRLVAPDRERRVPHRVEDRVADVSHVVDACSRPDHRPRGNRPRDAEAWRNVVLVRFVGAPAEPAVPHVLDIGRELKRGIPFIRIASSRADEDRRVGVGPVEVDVHDRVVGVDEGLVVLPTQPVVHREVRPKAPAVLGVEREVVGAEVGNRRANLRFGTIEVSRGENRRTRRRPGRRPVREDPACSGRQTRTGRASRRRRSGRRSRGAARRPA